MHESRRTCCVKSRHAGVNKRLEVLYSCRARCPITVSLAPAKISPHLYQIQHLRGHVHLASKCNQGYKQKHEQVQHGNALMTA